MIEQFMIFTLQVVCSSCSDYRAPLQYKKFQPDRVCEQCFNFLWKSKHFFLWAVNLFSPPYVLWFASYNVPFVLSYKNLWKVTQCTFNAVVFYITLACYMQIFNCNVLNMWKMIILHLMLLNVFIAALFLFIRWVLSIFPLLPLFELSPGNISEYSFAQVHTKYFLALFAIIYLLYIISWVILNLSLSLSLWHLYIIDGMVLFSFRSEYI